MWCREYVIVTAVVHRRPITATRTFISILLVVMSSDGGEYGRLNVHLVPYTRGSQLISSSFIVNHPLSIIHPSSVNW